MPQDEKPRFDNLDGLAAAFRVLEGKWPGLALRQGKEEKTEKELPQVANGGSYL